MIYLDSAAMYPALPCAFKAYRTAPFGNPSSEHAVGQKARDALEQAREKTMKAHAYVLKIRECLTSCMSHTYRVTPEATIRHKDKPPTFIDYFLDAGDYTVGVEVKSTLGDLYSGWGRNFVCDLNYLICPPDLVAAACRLLERLNERDVGVIACGKGKTTIIRPATWKCNALYGRQHDASLQFIVNGWDVGEHLCNAL